MIQILTLENPHPIRLSVLVTMSLSGLVVVAVGVFGFLTSVLHVLGSDSCLPVGQKTREMKLQLLFVNLLFNSCNNFSNSHEKP